MQVSSMTGFGRGDEVGEWYQVSVEMASVNRKQAEVVFSWSRELSELESGLRQRLLQQVTRGRVQVTVQVQRLLTGAAVLRVDANMARALEGCVAELAEIIGRPLQARVEDFLRVPGLLRDARDQLDLPALEQVLESAFDQALNALVLSRRREGEQLALDLQRRLAVLERWVAEIAQQIPERQQQQRRSLEKRLQEFELSIRSDDDQVIKELAMMAERADITEEITRLRSHFHAFSGYLRGTEPCGRPLDFLCQEIHREFNTIGAKANHAAIAHAVVAAKTELESMREQVQNLE